MAHSSGFLRLRAVGQVALLISMVCQSALLAQQDSVVPSAAGFMATLIAVLGHVLLVGKLAWGLTGAALATTLGNLAGAAALVYGLSRWGKVIGTQEILLASEREAKH